MDATVTESAQVRHRVLPEKATGMASASLRKSARWADIGNCLEYARHAAGWNLDQLADAMQRDPRQVRRWIAGEEQTQIAVVFSVDVLRAPFVIALARLAHCDVETTVRIRA